MYQNRRYSDITVALPDLFSGVLDLGVNSGSRNGDVKELTHIGVTLDRPLLREILVPTRKANLAAQIAETMWVLSGRDDIAFLGHYLPRAAQFSDDQQVWRGGYGKRLRAWPRRNPGDVIDQVAFVVDMLKADPLTRRAVAMIYDPDVDSGPGLDIPCNNWLHFLQRDGHVDLHVTIRSNDLMWGWSGINQFEWSALLEVVARLSGFSPGALHFSISSLHVYEPHWAKGAKIAQWGPDTDEEFDLVGDLAASPEFSITDLEEFDNAAAEWFAMEAAIRQGLPYRSVETIADPMLRSWMRVIEWWWTGRASALVPLEGTRLHRAAMVALQPPHRGPGFVDFVANLHREKHEAYGDSWKRRGEMLGIMANIARKIDRLGVAGAGDTAADTAIDLFVYLLKYRLWLSENAGSPCPIDHLGSLTDDYVPVTKYLLKMEETFSPCPDSLEAQIEVLKSSFEHLEWVVNNKPSERDDVVEYMLFYARSLAGALWAEEAKGA